MKKLLPLFLLVAMALAAFTAAGSDTLSRAELEAAFKQRDEVLMQHAQMLVGMRDYFTDLQKKKILPLPSKPK